MALDDRYVLMQDIQEYFVNKDTGEPLSGGFVYFWEDDARNTPKSVYELTGAPPNYTYSPLPNPMQLSAVGTPMNDNGEDVAVYFFPYDSVEAGASVQNYFIQVFDSNLVPQLTRQAWPNLTQENSAENESAGFENQISNPQFVEILFDEDSIMSLPYTGAGSTDFDIAPGWFVRVTHSNAGTATVERILQSGSDNIETQPPYTLEITAGNNCAALELIQRFDNNSDIWSASTTDNGYLNAGALIWTSDSLDILYRPSDGNGETILLSQTNNSGMPKYYNATVQLPIGTNTEFSDVAYIDIVISLPPAGPTRFSSVQVVQVLADDEDVAYEQQSANRQRDYLSHYYKPYLAQKPIPSYLVGWDFPLNPSQFYVDGTRAAQAIGANKSEYKWDQTIVFQSANSGVSVARGTSGGLELTAAAPTQMAVIQYLDQRQAREILSGRLSVALSGISTLAGGVNCTISLWATSDATLPVVAAGTNNSIVLTLDANGKPATLNGAWTEVPRSNLGDATFLMDETQTEVYFSGWDMSGDALVTTATYFAIVIGTESMASDAITFDWVGLCHGEFATRPAPQTYQAVLRDCEYFYEKSYADNVVAATVTSVNALLRNMMSSVPTPGTSGALATAFDIEFKTLKKDTNSTVSIYSDVSGTLGNVRGWARGAATTNTEIDIATYFATSSVGDKLVSYSSTTSTIFVPVAAIDATTPAQTWISFHYVADDRLGIV